MVLLSGMLVSLPLVSFSSQEEPSVGDIFKNIGSDQGAIFTSPLRMDRGDAWVWGAAGISALVFMPSYQSRRSRDERFAQGIERENIQYKNMLKQITLIGDGKVLFSASLASYGMASIMDYTPLQRSSARWVEALTDATLWVTVIKMIAGRNRPGGTKPESEFAGPGGYFHEQGVNSSFPSGHTTLAFASAAVWTRESGNKWWVGVPLYLTAGAVGYSRIYVEKHWLTDTLIGAALGHSIGMLVENRRGTKKKESSARLQPLMGEDMSGLAWVVRW